MSNFVLTCWRNPLARTCTAEQLRELVDCLTPSNISANRPILRESPWLALAVMNPLSSVRQKHDSVCLGSILDSKEDWWKPGMRSPDGSYAICRTSNECIELLADDLGSRPLWYVQTPEIFLASTTQRAIVRLLGDFSLNPQAISWMMSAGCLGPEDSWDSRLRRLPQATRLRLDRHSWELSSFRAAPDEVPARPIREADQVGMLGKAVAEACEALDVDMSDWRLPLSGGKDSRCLLIHLRRAGHRPGCITWGLERSRLDRNSDAHIAPLVAKALGVEHEYFEVDRCAEPVQEAIGRFITLSEGLVDHVSGYTDGLAMWRRLYESGLAGIVRGEVAMGWYVVKSPEQGRRSIVPSVSDFSPRAVIRQLDLPDQTWPQHLRQLPQETAQQHADRLYFEIRLPRVLAALNHVKCPYTEFAEPLLSRAVVDVSRRILLTGRAIPVMQTLTEKEGPPVPFATAAALLSVERCVREAPFAREVRRELSSETARRVFSTSALECMIGALNDHSSDKGLAWRRALRRVSQLAPARAHRAASHVMSVSIPPFHLAFRAYVASRTVDLFVADAAGGRPDDA